MKYDEIYTIARKKAIEDMKDLKGLVKRKEEPDVINSFFARIDIHTRHLIEMSDMDSIPEPIKEKIKVPDEFKEDDDDEDDEDDESF